MTKPAIQSAKLQLSAINVRTPRNDLIEQLAADVDARGIIQNLIVAPLKKPRGSFAVIAGCRRYRALMLLSERRQIDAAQYDVPVMVIEADDAELSETSLAENFHPQPRSPADGMEQLQELELQLGRDPPRHPERDDEVDRAGGDPRRRRLL